MQLQPVRRAAPLLVLLLLAATAWWTTQLVQQSRRVLTELQALPQLASAPATWFAAGPAALARSRAELQQLQQLLGPFPLLAGGLRPLPLIGPTAAALAPLLEAADATLQSAAALTRAAAPLQAAAAGTDLLSALRAGDVAARLTAQQPLLLEAQQAARRAESAWQRVPARAQLLPLAAEQLARYEASARLVGPLADSAVLALELAVTFEPLVTALEPLGARDAVTLLSAGDTLVSDAVQQAARRRAPVEAAAAQAALSLATVDVTALPAGLQPFVTQLIQLPAVSSALLQSLTAADATLPPLLQLVDGTAAGGARIERLISGLAGLRPQLAAAQRAWQTAATDWRALALPGLPMRLITLHDEAADALELLQTVPQLFGSDGRRRYLLLALSNDELRPSGGFITSAGVLTVTRGRISAPQMEDSGLIRPRSGIAAPYPPQPLREAMRSDQWYFLDATWPADFRAAAQVAGRLYALSGRTPADDVIALDLDALETLVEAFGPLTVTGARAPLVTRADVQAFIQQQYAQSGDNSAELGALARALIDRIDEADIEPAALMAVIGRLADERHLQLALQDTDEAALIAARGWDGAVRAGPQDFLMLIDANVGFSKSSRKLQQRVVYTVDLRAPLSPRATLDITRRLALPTSTVCRDERAGNYQWLASRCQRSYLQVLAPAAAALLGSSLPPSAAGWTWGPQVPLGGALRVTQGDGATRAFSWYSALYPGETQQTQLRYSLPAGVVDTLPDGRQRYRLRVQRQAGAAPLALELQLQLPAGYRIISSEPALQADRLQLTVDSAALITIIFGR